VPGDLLKAANDQSGAECYYRQANAVAEQQSAKLFQLRASASLARLWRDQGRRMEARNLLMPIYGWFIEGFDTPDLEGFDTPDLKDAKALLDELT
jgi:predicted ATPase